MAKGIDISYHNGEINFKQLKNSVDFVIIRASCSRHEDKMLAEYVAGCEENNIPYGFYHAMYATTRERAEYEANLFLSWLEGKSFEYPVYLDIEDKCQTKLDKKTITDIALAFCETVENAGYFTGIYTYKSFFENNLDMSRLNRFTVWLAHYTAKTNYKGAYDMWQYSSKSRVPGISTLVDVDVSYKDFAPIIKRAKLNGTFEPVKLFEVSAVKTGLTKPQANKLAENLSKMGMNVGVK